MRNSFLVLALFFVASCTSTGATNNPLVRQFQYYSYLNGDDIRKSCKPGLPSQYRLVYNALYEKQVRSYDIRQGHNQKVGIQETRVFSRGLGSQFEIGADGVDFKSHFHSIESLAIDDLVTIDKALIASGFEKPSRNGQILYSDAFYWIAMICRGGNFKYYAWTEEDTDIDSLPLHSALEKGDTTSVDVLKYYVPIIHDRGAGPQNSNGQNEIGYFSLIVGDNELKL